MQRTADFHEQIADTHLPQAAGVVDNAAALDAAVDLLDAHPSAGNAPLTIKAPAGHMCLERGIKGRVWRSANRHVPMAVASFRLGPPHTINRDELFWGEQRVN